MVTSIAAYWNGSLLWGWVRCSPTSAGRILRLCRGTRPGGSMWTSWGESTVFAAGAACRRMSKRVSRTAFDSAVFEAWLQWKRWSPSLSNSLLQRQRPPTSEWKSGNRSFRRIAVLNIWLSSRKRSAVRGK